MDPLVALVLATVVGYLVGSLSFAVIVSRLFGLPDPHSYGSGNPGATNVLRTGRKLAAALTLLGDAGKGAVAVGLGSLIAPAGGDAAALAGIAAFLGHLFPVFFGFRGGKGVATAAGILLALDPRLGGLTLGVWLVMAVVFRYSSLAAVSAALVAPFGAAWFGAGPVGTVAVVAMSALLLWRHRGNLARLLAGQETRIGSGRRGAAAGKAG